MMPNQMTKRFLRDVSFLTADVGFCDIFVIIASLGDIKLRRREQQTTSNLLDPLLDSCLTTSKTCASTFYKYVCVTLSRYVAGHVVGH